VHPTIGWIKPVGASPRMRSDAGLDTGFEFALSDIDHYHLVTGIRSDHEIAPAMIPTSIVPETFRGNGGDPWEIGLAVVDETDVTAFLQRDDPQRLERRCNDGGHTHLGQGIARNALHWKILAGKWLQSQAVEDNVLRRPVASLYKI